MKSYRLALAALVGLLLAGCGSSSTKTTASNSVPTTTSAGGAPTTSTPASTTPATTTTAPATTKTSPGKSTAPSGPEKLPTEADIRLTSPAVVGEALPARYTCDGQNTPLPLHWSGIPAGTKELMLDVLKVSPVNGKLFIAWAVANIEPDSTGITNGKPPAGAVVGANSEGKTAYNVCPPKGGAEPYVAVLFALPRHLQAQPGFDGAALRKQALRTANFEGFVHFTYTRK